MSDDKSKDGNGWFAFDESQRRRPGQTETVRRALYDKLLGQLSTHREKLIGTLQSARDQTGRAKAFDADKVWLGISSLAVFYRLPDKAKLATANNEERLRAISAAAHRLVELISDTDPELFQELALTIWGQTEEGKDPYTTPFLWGEVERLRAATATISAIQLAATSAANEYLTRPGRPRDRRREDTIEALAALYSNATGLTPTTSKYGPFADFVLAFLDAIGQKARLSGVVDSIKIARNNSLNRPQSSAPSPFRRRGRRKNGPKST